MRPSLSRSILEPNSQQRFPHSFAEEICHHACDVDCLVGYEDKLLVLVENIRDIQPLYCPSIANYRFKFSVAIQHSRSPSTP